MNEYSTMATAKLLRLLASREERIRWNSELRYYPRDRMEYGDVEDESIIDSAADELERRIDVGAGR